MHITFRGLLAGLALFIGSLVLVDVASTIFEARTHQPYTERVDQSSRP
jgi:hypothetical protein